MFTLYFNYIGKDIAVKDVWGFGFSPKGRMFYVKVKENDKLITHSYYSKYVLNLMFSV